MGEHNARFLVRAGGAVAAAAAVVALSSCSLLQVAPSPVATSSPQQSQVTDPSIPVPTTSATDASTPDPSATPFGSPTPSPTPTLVPGSTKRAVSPFVTLADWDASSSELDVSAIVPNLVESGGTCTATATQGAVVRTASAPAAAVSTYVGCNPMTIPGSLLSAGTWTVHVTYSSRTATGVSAAKTVEVTR